MLGRRQRRPALASCLRAQPHPATNGSVAYRKGSAAHASGSGAANGADRAAPCTVVPNGKRAGETHADAPKRARASATASPPASPSPAPSLRMSPRASPPRRPLILTRGTRGDVQPFLPLCQAMLSAGWSPLLSSLEAFRSLAAEADLPFAPLVPDGACDPPPVDEPDEKSFHAGVADFYEQHGDVLDRHSTILLYYYYTPT